MHTEKCAKSKKQNNDNKQNNKNKFSKLKARRLSNLDVSKFLLLNEIKTDADLFAKACEQNRAGKKDLTEFILSKSPKSLHDLILT